MRGITLTGIEATGIDHPYPLIIAGLRRHPICDVTLARLSLHYRGGGTAEDAARVPEERPDAYPEPSMFGPLPAWGLWARHVQGLTVDGLALSHDGLDARAAIILDRVTKANAQDAPFWP